jgi:hypothetical protein
MEYTLLVYHRATPKRAYRLVREIDYTGVSGNYMMDEMHALRADYPTKEGYLLTFTETANVRNHSDL